MTEAPQRFYTLLADPPWPETGGGKIKRGAQRHYPVLPVREMEPTIRGSGLWNPESTAHFYLWVTNRFLPDGLALMSALGFRYVTNLAWVKDRAGLGQYFRGQHELLLFGVRGDGLLLRRAHTERRDLVSVLDARRGRHSEKPQSSYELIEAASPGPYVEFFARSRRPGWVSWGNDAAVQGEAT
jgi:N6-adenosine-specific RNA methylase IME4